MRRALRVLRVLRQFPQLSYMRAYGEVIRSGVTDVTGVTERRDYE